MHDASGQIDRCRNDINPLVAGAAHAYAVRVLGDPQGLQPLVEQLRDDNAGRRRAAVIDLGDAGRIEALAELIRCPVSMPLRAKSAFQMATSQAGAIDPDASDLLKELLQDDPRRLNLNGIPETPAEPEAIKDGLQHRDEARQYAAAKALMALPRSAQLDQIDALRSSLGSDYGVHYLLASCTGLLELHERSDLVREALAETAPQYAKSRIAGAWSCLRLGLRDQTTLLEEVGRSHPWQPLQWSCCEVASLLA
jgi:HEAT repeat protein